MSTPQIIRFAGAVTLEPPSASCLLPSGVTAIPLDIRQLAQSSVNRALRVNTPSPGFLDLLANSGVTNLRQGLLIARNGIFTVRITWAGGVDQLIPLSEYWAFSNPQTGSQITALAIQGVGDLEMLIAGD
jgi:hypothetical protein